MPAFIIAVCNALLLQAVLVMTRVNGNNRRIFIGAVLGRILNIVYCTS